MAQITLGSGTIPPSKLHRVIINLCLNIVTPGCESHESPDPDYPGGPAPAHVIKYVGDGGPGVLEEVGQHEGHNGGEAEVGEEDDAEREDDCHRHHLLGVDHLLPHRGDHIEAHEPVEGTRGPVNDPVHAVRKESTVPAPTVASLFSLAYIRLNNFKQGILKSVNIYN